MILGIVVNIQHPTTQDVEAQGSHIQSYPQLCKEFEANLENETLYIFLFFDISLLFVNFLGREQGPQTKK